MGATLTQQYRVDDEGLWVVKSCRGEEVLYYKQWYNLTVPPEEAPANSVPAAAVIRREQALFGITGRKGRVGGVES